jgi:predicted Abi (CAAX) family protease
VDRHSRLQVPPGKRDLLETSVRRILQLVLRRLVRSYTAWPSAARWGEAALLLSGAVLVALPIGMQAGLLKFSPTSDPLWKIAVFAAAAFLVPSLFEETIYRGLLLPHAAEQRSLRFRAASAIVSVLLFVVGHPLTAWLILPAWRELSYNGVFLALCGVYGLATSIAYLRSGSIWPSAAMHWTIVVAWKLWFGGATAFFG